MAMKIKAIILIIFIGIVIPQTFSQTIFLDTDSIPKPHNHLPTDQVSITNSDNENNANQGFPDWDMDVYLGRLDENVPIEFNIFVEDLTIGSAQLNILAWDVDWDPGPGRLGERDQVWLNGHFLGYLSGANEQWSTTIFDVNPSIVIPGPSGKNLVQIYVDEYGLTWKVNVDWGQLVINNPESHAEFRYVIPDKTEYYPEETMKINEEADAEPGMYARVETNLMDPSGGIIAGQDHYLWITSGDEPFTIQLKIPRSAVAGDYTIMAILYEASTNIQHDIMYVPITILPACLNPYHGGYILSSQRQCGEFDPDPIYTYPYYEPYGHTGGNLEYKWQYSHNTYDFIDIPGTNSADYDPDLVKENTFFRRLVRVDCKTDWSDALESNYVLMEVKPIPDLYVCEDKQIYIGYPPYEAQLSANSSVNGYWSWSPQNGLSNPFISDPIASPSVTTTYTVIFMGYNGCSISEEVTVNVTDVRCGNNMKKVLVCHLPPGNPGNPQTICVGAPAVPAHLDHGDYLGECVDDKSLIIEDSPIENEISVYPNPTNGQTTIELRLLYAYSVEIFITDIFGNKIESIHNGPLQKGSYDYKWNTNSMNTSGMYLLYMITDEETLVKKIIIK